MIGDDAVAGLRLAFGGYASERDGRRDQGAEQIDLVIVMGALQHRGNAFEPHAGVDGRLRQVHALPRQLLILHEDEIPDLDEAVAVCVGAAGRAALHARAMVIENLGAGTAGPKLAH